ncbi:hypothetical protein CGC48_01495 [Capnocytophaga cynodegmi]|uniref:Uncharacterized protein n=1 Tax=Capnocytophaga cynodegmi TaxID=28189 RepID=A0A286NTM7_9FLAO|nr:hypothetical protein [Capnocytophaga cynodegmi]ATA67414.1 hypothetical protein CGC48_01495 [Capnocytophaga cynodegmi]
MNGTKRLIDLFENEEKFIEFFIKNCYFMPVKSVQDRATEMLETIKSGGKLPIRYGKKLNTNYKVDGAKALDKKDKKAITEFADKGNLRFNEKNIFVSIDPTGNQAVVNAIHQATKQ